MRVGFVGLGKMGRQIVQKLLQDGHEVVVFDTNQEAVQECKNQGAHSSEDRADLVKKLGKNPIVWLMIPADYVHSETVAYSELLPAGGILIDGGNSHFQGSIDRAKLCAEKQISFVDVGTSGGILGLTEGFSMMIGGEKNTFETLEPLFVTLAAPNSRYAYMGQSGSGHFVKMVHNGIEYAIMQSYAEGYDLLKYGGMLNLDLVKIAEVWQGGSIIQSSLNDLIQKILTENPELDGISGYVADSGEGKWTYEVAELSNVPMPALRVALEVRKASQNGYSTFATKLLAAMRNKFGGHAINK